MTVLKNNYYRSVKELIQTPGKSTEIFLLISVDFMGGLTFANVPKYFYALVF